MHADVCQNVGVQISAMQFNYVMGRMSMEWVWSGYGVGREWVGSGCGHSYLHLSQELVQKLFQLFTLKKVKKVGKVYENLQ